MKLEITKYDWQLVNGQPKIVISMVKVMEDDGTYIKFAKLKEILPYLSGHPVTFKPIVKPEKPVNRLANLPSLAKRLPSRELPRIDKPDDCPF